MDASAAGGNGVNGIDPDSRAPDLNTLLAQYLRVARSTGKTVVDVAGELFDPRGTQDPKLLATEVENAMAHIEEYMRVAVGPHGAWGRRREKAAQASRGV
jgi:hypothetical protein